MVFRRVREIANGILQIVVHGSSREFSKLNKILKSIDENNVENFRTLVQQIDRKELEEFVQRPVDWMRRTPLHFAAWAENTEFLEFFLEFTDNVDIQDKTGATPMMFVIGSRNNSTEKLELFIKKKADVNRKDKTGWTLLHAAVQSKNREMLEILLNNGGDINIVDIELRSLLHIACETGDLALVKYLVEKEAPLNVKDENGWTPLHIACGPSGDFELVRFLVGNGADKNARDFNGYTPRDLALQFQTKNVEKFLRDSLDSSTDDDQPLDDSSLSEFSFTNETYESDDVFESEGSSNR